MFKADKLKTFLLPYNACNMLDEAEFADFNPCSKLKDCCLDCIEKNAVSDSKGSLCGRCCDDITVDMMLCFHDDLQDFYGCETPYQLLYDCDKALKFINEITHEDTFGQKFCVKDFCEDSVISGRFYSETDLPTKDITLTIIGTMHNPWITINGNTNIIEGDYEGRLTIYPSGDIYYLPKGKDEACEELLDPSVWVIPEGMDYQWEIVPQWNGFSIKLNACCDRTCVYIDHQPLTI